MPSVSIIIPTRNEAGNIAPLLARIAHAVTVIDTEILFVDDGSTDATRTEIRCYSGSLQVRLICRDDTSGLATAVCAGAQAAQGEYLVVMDADLSHPPENIPDLLAPLQNKTHDMVIGSRYIKRGATLEWPLARKAASRLATLPARLFTEARDPLSGFFSIRKEVFLAMQRQIAGFKIGLEILAAAGDWLRIAEIPIIFTDRKNGRSKMNKAVFRDYLKQLAGLAGIAMDGVCARELLSLAGIVATLDLLFFYFLGNQGLHLDIVHSASFLLACNLGYLIAVFAGGQPHVSFQTAVWLRYNIVLLLALFLRGGIISVIDVLHPDYPILLYSAAASTSAFAAIIGYLHVSAENLKNRRSNWRSLAFFIIVYSILLRLLYSGSYELIQEEAYYWNYSRHMAMGYLDHPPVVSVLIWLGTHIFGHSEFGVRFAAFFCWFFTAWFSSRLTADLFGSKASLNALVLIATLPIFFGAALVITPDAPLISCWAGTLFFLHRALMGEKSNAWLGVGICLGLGLASKYTIALLGPATFFLMLFDPKARRWFRKPHPYLAAGIALALFSPVLYWNYQHDWASFLFQSQRRIAAVTQFSSHELLASILLLITPTGLLAAWISYRSRGNNSSQNDAIRQRHKLFALCMTLTPLFVFFLFSISKEIKLSWAGPLWLAFIPLIATSMPTRFTVSLPRPLIERLWPATLAILLIGYGGVLHYFSLGIPGIPYGNSAFLFGCDDLAAQIEQTVARIEDQKGSRPIVAGMDKYRIASGLAFYRNKQHEHANASPSHPVVEDTTGRQLFGIDALMYNYWLHPEQAVDRDILAIGENREDIANHFFLGWSTHLGKIGRYSIKKHGKEVGSYYFRLVHRYSPPEKSQEIAKD